jgi:hypothetical protein
MIKFIVGPADELGESVNVNPTGSVGRLGDLLYDETVHDYPRTSAKDVTVIVWL